MNLSPIYLGSVGNDRTGDTLRSGGFKINGAFSELFWAAPARHRHSPLVYRQTAGAADYISAAVVVGPSSWQNTVTVTLQAPFVGSIGARNDERGERNLAVLVSTDVAPAAWVINHLGASLPDTVYTHYLYVERNFADLTVAYGYSLLAPVSQQTAPTSPATDQHWFDQLHGVTRRWNGSSWDDVYRLFIGTLNFVGPGTSQPTGAAGAATITYDWTNDELVDMRKLAIQSAIVFG